MDITVINGPNLNLLGTRENSIYGTITLAELTKNLEETFPKITFHFFQSNIEGEIINAIHACTSSHIIINAGAYTHTSVGIADALKAVGIPYVEVHISNTYSRETFRHQSYLAAEARGIIIGFGMKSYHLAVASIV